MPTTDLNPITEMRSLDDLHPHPDNPRRGNVQEIAESLSTTGQYAPIVALPDGTVLAGSHRLAAARSLGWSEMLVTTITADEETARRILLADNRTSDLATYDDRALVDLLASLDTLTGTGFDVDDLDDLNALLQETAISTMSDAVDSGSKVTKDKDLNEHVAAYRDKAVRSIILDYRLDQFAWLTDAADRAREKLKCASFADLFLHLVAEAMSEDPPGA